MSHRADTHFFDKKRDWSKRKDQILAYYLEPYLAKIAALRKPILIVDGFAGRGKYLDGEPGSPLIIRAKIQTARAKRNAGTISAVFVEPERMLADVLVGLVGDLPNATVRCERFGQVIPDLERAAQTHSTFLYLDPYTVEGLEWQSLGRVLSQVSSDRSVEMLLNFNVDSFARRGLAALSMKAPTPDESLPEAEAEDPSAPVADGLDSIIGGSWWRSILASPESYPRRVERITQAFCDQLRKRFAEVCVHEIREKSRHLVPKYVLVFCSRHPDTRELMNDAMVVSLRTLADQEKPEQDTLFETRPESLVPDANRLPELVLQAANERKSRKELVYDVLGLAFGSYPSGDIRRAIGGLIKQGQLCSDRLDRRQNDETQIWRP